MVWSVTVTKFGTTRRGVVGVGLGAWERPVDPRAHSRTVLRRNFFIGHLIALPLGFNTDFRFGFLAAIDYTSDRLRCSRFCQPFHSERRHGGNRDGDRDQQLIAVDRHQRRMVSTANSAVS